MSLTVDLTSDEVAQIKQITSLQDDGAAVTKAAREYLRLTRLRELKAVSGRVDYDDASAQLETLELGEIGFPKERKAAMEDRVLADTVIWASFFSKPDSPEKRAVDDLIDADRVVLIGPIVAEVLLGFRRKAQADWVASRLRAAHFFEATWDDWKSAAEIGRELAAKGHAIPITDLIIAAVAKRTGTAVYSTDPHFDLIPELRRHHPAV